MLSESWENWSDANRSEITAVIGEITEQHPALRASYVIDRLCKAVRTKDSRAIRLALSLLASDPRMPFGRGLKSQIARAFKAIARELTAYERDTLSRYSSKLSRLEHPPREAREFARLVRSFETE
jgi:hypothetical protein